MKNGREDEIQTRDLSLPKRAHYQAVLLPDLFIRRELTDHLHLNRLKHPFEKVLQR